MFFSLISQLCFLLKKRLLWPFFLVQSVLFLEGELPYLAWDLILIGLKFWKPLRLFSPSQLQVDVWKTASNEAITLESMNFEEMEMATAYKASGEATNLLGDSQEEYNILKVQYSSAESESERTGVLQQMKNLLLTLFYRI